MKIINLKNLIFCLIAISLMISCEKDKNLGNPAEEATILSSITIGQTAYNSDSTTIYLLKGQELQLNCTLAPSEGVTFPDIIWSSSDETVVAVSENGKLTAGNVGSAIVRITPAIGFGPAAATPALTVNVVDHYVYMNSVSITGAPASTDSIAVGENVQLSATYTTDSGDPATFVRYKWSSSNTAVATVDNNGLVTGTGQGTVTITATADDDNPGQQPSATTTIGVKTIIPIETFDIPDDPELGMLGYGETYQIKFNVTPANATVSSIVWASDNPAAVSVSNKGVLTVNVMDGASAIITATAGNIVKNINVAVAQGRLCYSFANSFAPWTVTTAGAAWSSTDGTKTTIQMTNPGTDTSTKHRGDINLATNGSGVIVTMNLSTYRYLAVKVRVPTVLVAGTNSNGCFKLEMWDYPNQVRTIGPAYWGSSTSTTDNNVYTILDGDAITPDSPNVLYFDLQGKWSSGNPTSWTTPFSIVQFKFTVADYPATASWLYDIYWVRTFKTLDELTAFASSN